MIVCVGKVQRLTKIVICYYNGPKQQWKGKPLFEMCRFHMDIARKGLSIYYVIREGSSRFITILHRGGSPQFITILHRGGSSKFITILQIWLEYERT